MPEIVLNIFFLILGLVILTAGADRLVEASSRLALRLGVKPLTVGLTVVAFGTSAPELVVSVQSALAGSGGIAFGNVVGSNICNVALILGLSALICPLLVSKQLFKFDIPVCILASLLVWLFLNDGTLHIWEGCVFAALFIGYVVYMVLTGKDDGAGEVKSSASKKGSVAGDLLFIALGLAMLAGGAYMFVDLGAVKLAKMWGVSDALIGLTVVAVGTSLPELATSAVAAFKKQNDIAIGNIVGSNIFNILLILGTVGLMGPAKSDGIMLRDILLMTGLPAVLFVTLLTKYKLGRWPGAALLLTYIFYIAVLCRRA